MPRLPQAKPREVEQVLLKIGFSFMRQKGSHRIYVRDTVGITIPFHSKNLKKGTLSAIIKASGISPDEFINLL